VTGSGRQATLEFLLRRMRHKSDFPGTLRVGQRDQQDCQQRDGEHREALQHHPQGFRADQQAASPGQFRLLPAGRRRQSISTVSRAVIVLGFEAVRNIAITVLLFEHLQNKGNANQLKEDFLRANLAGVLAKDIGATAQMRDLEQSFICSLFHSLGRLLSQFYFPEESDEIRLVMAQKACRRRCGGPAGAGHLLRGVGHCHCTPVGLPAADRQYACGNCRPGRSGNRRSRKIGCACCPALPTNCAM
jgi:hypothetical protein